MYRRLPCASLALPAHQGGGHRQASCQSRGRRCITTRPLYKSVCRSKSFGSTMDQGSAGFSARNASQSAVNSKGVCLGLIALHHVLPCF